MKSVWNKKSDSFAGRHSIFIKLAAILIVVGLVPLLVIGGIMLNRFIGNMQKILLNNTEQMNYSAASGVEGILRDIDDQTMSLYRYYTCLLYTSGMIFQNMVHASSYSEEEAKYIRKFVFQGTFAILFDWLNSDTPEPVEHIAAVFGHLRNKLY